MRNRKGTSPVGLKLAGLSVVLTFLAGYTLFVLAPAGSTNVASMPPETTPQVFLPFVVRSGDEGPSLTIYDLNGMERDWEWLVATFGAVTLQRGTGTASVTVLRAIEGPSTLVVHVENIAGDPLPNVPVAFYWPDAPVLPSEKRACGLDRGIIGDTKDNGNAEFAMGRGAYYFPPNGGPHVVWVVVTGTDCLGGLGMLGGTNHIHLDSVWRMP
ncbi:MAG: hypothetical protein ACUVWZ_05200 [Anaerolineae bacterium]